jgi:hypothetical protein
LLPDLAASFLSFKIIGKSRCPLNPAVLDVTGTAASGHVWKAKVATMAPGIGRGPSRVSTSGRRVFERLKTAEAREASSAFAERRQPNFTNVA